jgi:hypothetical protein
MTKNRKWMVALAALFLVALGVHAASKKSRYLVIAPHTPEQCLAALDQFEQKAPALLEKVDWGCMAGDHTGYLRVEAEDDAAALASLPEGVRSSARAVKLGKFTPEQIRAFHKK